MLSVGGGLEGRWIDGKGGVRVCKTQKIGRDRANGPRAKLDKNEKARGPCLARKV